jgi:hypothetical protein
MNRTIRQMQNDLTRLRRGENFAPTNQNPRVPSQEQRINPLKNRESEMKMSIDKENQGYKSLLLSYWKISLMKKKLKTLTKKPK